MLILVLLTFIAVFLICASIFIAFTTVKESPAFALKMRLRRLARDKNNASIPEHVRSDILKDIPPIEKFLINLFLFRDIDRKLDQAGLKIQPHRFILFSATSIIVPAIAVFLIFHRASHAMLLAAIISLGIATTLKVLKQRREDQFTEQLPDILMMISRSLRAGHSLSSAIELVGIESANPAGGLFKTAYDQQKLGLSVSNALANITDRIDSLDLRFFITTVDINSEIGGNLAEMLDKLASTIRERGKVRRQVRVYTAQGRFSGYVLACLPIAMFIIINVMNPEYGMVLIKEKLGNYFLIVAFIFQLIGFVLIKNIINIRI